MFTSAADLGCPHAPGPRRARLPDQPLPRVGRTCSWSRRPNGSTAERRAPRRGVTARSPTCHIYLSRRWPVRRRPTLSALPSPPNADGPPFGAGHLHCFHLGRVRPIPRRHTDTVKATATLGPTRATGR